MNRTIRYIIKGCILIAYLIILAFILNSHYIESGECALRVYYYPLDRCDYVMIALIGITMLLSSLHYIRTNKYLRWLESSIYCSIIIITIVFGNSIIASRTIDWPDKYHPTSYNMEKRIETQLMGMWTYHAGNGDSDNFLTDTITFVQDNLFYNEDGIFQYTYHIEDNKLFIHRPNQAVKQYKADIVGDTLKLTLLKEAFFEFDVELRQVELSNDIPSPSYKYIKLN